MLLPNSRRWVSFKASEKRAEPEGPVVAAPLAA